MKWAGVDRISERLYLWCELDSQIEYCTVNSLEEARTNLQNYYARISRNQTDHKVRVAAHRAWKAAERAKKKLQKSKIIVHSGEVNELK